MYGVKPVIFSVLFTSVVMTAVTIASAQTSRVFVPGQLDSDISDATNGDCLVYVDSSTMDFNSDCTVGGVATTSIDTEAKLESILTDVTDVFTNNDGALADDDLSDNNTGDLAEGSNLYYTEARVSANTDVTANTSARHNAVTLSGALDYITLVGQDIVRGAIDLANDITGVLSLANGGFGVSQADPNDDRISFWDDSASQFNFLDIGTNLSISGTTINAATGDGDTITTTINNYRKDSTAGTGDTYGILSGAVNGVNTDYTVSESVYGTGTLTVYRNGQRLVQGSSEDWVELVPGSGTIRFNTAPFTGDVIDVEYSTTIITATELIYDKNTISITASSTVASTTGTVLVDASSGDIVVTLPVPADIDRVGLDIKKIDSSANQVFIIGPSSQTIDGIATSTLTAPQSAVTIKDDESNYYNF